MFSSEDYTNKIDQQSLDGNVLGHAGSTGGGDRTIISAYSELAFNPVESVEVQLAGRFDNYDDFGSTVNPKIGLRWQANSQLMFRASAGTGFKAPTLVEYACAQLGGAYCQAQQYEVKQGGNKDLKEEKSVSYNLGAMYQIARRTSLGLDLWMVELEDAVGMDLNKATEYERINGPGSAAQHGIAITRDNQGRIITMDAKLQNLGSRDLTGLDVTFSHGQNTGIGDFSIKMEHSHMLKYDMETFPGLGVEDILGTNGAPKWRNNVTFGYVPSFHQASSIYLIAKTTAANKKSDETQGELKRYTEWDFQYNLQLPWKATATLGVINLFGSTPPLDETSANEKLNASLYNPIGQSFYLQYVQSF
jgi:iron complex outermembrane receptor protein